VGFQLLFSGIATIVEGLRVFLNIVSDCRCARVFKLLVYLGAGVYIVVLFRALRAYNLLLLRVPSCLIAAAVHRVFIEFPFKSSRNFKGGRVGVNN
jgi:uncharacterized membrane protein HdeD (DUF308 family)